MDAKHEMSTLFSNSGVSGGAALSAGGVMLKDERNCGK